MNDLYHADNMYIMDRLFADDFRFRLIYADCIYEDTDLTWVSKCLRLLVPNGIFIVQTDYHTVAAYKELLDLTYLTFVNHLVWKNEWGNHPKDRFHQCFDDILVYCNGKNWKFYSDRIQVPKATAKTKLNPSGRQTKTATAWIDDICLTTTSKERIKESDGHLVKWQKPLKLFDRIVLPFTDEAEWVFEPFGGTFPLCRWAKLNNRHAVGIEVDRKIFELGKKAVDST